MELLRVHDRLRRLGRLVRPRAPAASRRQRRRLQGARVSGQPLCAPACDHPYPAGLHLDAEVHRAELEAPPALQARQESGQPDGRLRLQQVRPCARHHSAAADNAAEAGEPRPGPAAVRPVRSRGGLRPRRGVLGLEDLAPPPRRRPPGRWADMSARRLMGGAAAAFAGGLVLSVCPALTVANPPAARASSLAILQITTVPAVPDARVTLDGVTRLTGVTGTLTISTFVGTHRIEARPPTSPPPASAVRFSRWLDGITRPGRAITLHQGLNNMQVGFQLSHPISVRQHYTFAPDQPPSRLPANRIVRDQFGLVALPNRYSVREVMFNGANVVYSGNQSFWVQPHRTWTVQLLLFPMRIEVRDALSGFAVGSAVRIRLAGGSGKTVKRGPGHAVTLRGMPRATYELVAKGPGIGLSSPATLTKPLVASLLLLSWVDFAAAGAFVVLFVIGLPLLGGRIRRRADGGRLLAWHVGHPVDRAGQPGKRGDEGSAVPEMPAAPEVPAFSEVPAF